MENTTPETATKTTDYTFIVGVEVCGISDNEWDARTIAKTNAAEKLRGILDDDSGRLTALLMREDNSHRVMTLPVGVELGEARRLLDWALASADRAPIDWDKFGEEFETDSKWQDARDELHSVPNNVFIQWLFDGNGGIFEYAFHLTPEAVQTNAEACEEQFLGSGSREEFTATYYEETGMLGNTPQEVLDAVDWDAVWYSSLNYDTIEVDGMEFETHFFRNY